MIQDLIYWVPKYLFALTLSLAWAMAFSWDAFRFLLYAERNWANPSDDIFLTVFFLTFGGFGWIATLWLLRRMIRDVYWIIKSKEIPRPCPSEYFGYFDADMY